MHFFGHIRRRVVDDDCFGNVGAAQAKSRVSGNIFEQFRQVCIVVGQIQKPRASNFDFRANTAEIKLISQLLGNFAWVFAELFCQPQRHIHLCVGMFARARCRIKIASHLRVQSSNERGNSFNDHCCNVGHRQNSFGTVLLVAAVREVATIITPSLLPIALG